MSRKKKRICECGTPTRYNPYIKDTHCIKCGGWIIYKESSMESLKEAVKYFKKHLFDEQQKYIDTLVDLAERYLAVEAKMPEKKFIKGDGIYLCPSCGQEYDGDKKRVNKSIDLCTLAVTKIRSE